MLGSEYASIASRHVDSDADDAALIAQIVAECEAGDDAIAVRYRHGLRERAALAEVAAPRESSIEFAADDVLWITGGTRGLGLLCAEHFVRRHGARKLVLHGREAFPPRSEWAARNDALGRKIRAIENLEALGAEVRVSSAPLLDEEALRRELDAVRGRVAGLLHCAGIMDFDTPALLRKSAATVDAVLAPKVAGLDNLLRALAGEPLRFAVLFSSVSATIPPLAAGQLDYAMANAYMDAVAEASPLPIVSVQWPSWKETGLGEATGAAYRDTGLLTLTNEEGLRLLDRVIGCRGSILPAIVDGNRWTPAELMRRKQPRTAAAPAGASLRETTVAWLKQLVSEQLNLDLAKVETDVPLQDYGVDSVMLVQLLAPVGAKVGEKLDPSLLFEYQTIDAFVDWLIERHAPKLEAPKAQPVVTVVEKSKDIAVVGMACRFPGANSLDGYWRLLTEGRSAIRSLPPERFGAGDGHAGLLDDVHNFDPAFFMIPPSTAAAMDPQALLLLEAALEAYAHAGYSIEQVKGSSAGVYVGARSQHRPDDALLQQANDPIVAVGQNYLAANISRFFDLRGPSLVVDTACSSALVALDLAVRALAAGEISSALVGGVSVLDGRAAMDVFARRGILHPEPRFHIFDRRAAGLVVGEGVGMVVLKSVEQARRDGDTILGVIKAIAINNDGRTAGPTSPNLQARKDVMQAALQRSGKRPEEIGYIDVNGSGSEVTDLLELKAIEAVYRAGIDAPCGLGSMKPNIGHPLCAEGIASFIKVVLMLHYAQRVPFLSAEEPMTHYDFASSPFRFDRAASAWSGARVAAINCFADGGTNAHVIVEGFNAPAELRRQPLTLPLLNRIPIRSESRAPMPPVSASFWKRPTNIVNPD